VAAKVICLAGAGSRSGRAFEILGPVIAYLIHAGGYQRTDFQEASYRVAADGEPLPYTAEDSTQPLVTSTQSVARSLIWFRQQNLGKLHLLGWSLGGVVLFDAAAELLRLDPSWASSLGSIVTIASPLLGSDVDGIDLLGDLAAGPVGADLARRAANEDAKLRVLDDAERLRGAGIRLVTLAAADDAVVTPDDALLPAPGSEPAAFILRPRPRPGASYLESVLGHTGLPYDPVCWQCVLGALGPACPLKEGR
jgi:pimeloyl-ACP methyl ester carboxylesterase